MKSKLTKKHKKSPFQQHSEAELDEDARILNEELGIEDEPKPEPQVTKKRGGKSVSQQARDRQEKFEQEKIKKHKTYKKMMKRFLPSSMEQEGHTKWSYGWHKERVEEDASWDDAGDDKEKEGYFPQEGETDGIVNDQYHYDYNYGYPYNFRRHHGHGNHSNKSNQTNNTKDLAQLKKKTEANAEEPQGLVQKTEMKSKK